jgi:hypothetical protein
LDRSLRGLVPVWDPLDLKVQPAGNT